MRARSLVAASVAAALIALPADDLSAQARASDENVQPRPIAASFAQIEESLTPRLVGADDAASRFVLGRLATLEPAAQTRDYAAAVAREPRQMLYVASLADACMRGTGGMVECTERDPVAYWVSRDAENAVPWLLQAERARRRNNVASMVDNLDRASRSARFDSYDQRAGAVLWSKLVGAVAPAERAAAALYAVEGTSIGSASLQALQALCGPQSRSLDARIAPACTRLGALMADRGSVLSDRRAGTQIALAAATTDAARATASEQARTVVAQQDRCREALQSVERGAVGDAAQRERSAQLALQYVEVRARDGESAACESLARAVAR